jgi:polar amino acid transport system substrate-binding protein
MVRKGQTDFTSLDAFKKGDYKVGTQTGTTNYEAAKKLYGAGRVEAYETFPFAVQALLNGDVDAVIIDDTAGQGYVGADKEKLELLPGGISSDELGFIYPKGSDLVGPVNYALAQMKADGSLQEISDKYFSPDFEPPVAD